MTTITKQGNGPTARGQFDKVPRGTNAVNFLCRFRREGPWVITSIIPDGTTRTRSFEDLEEARRFIVRRNDAEEGVYYTVNVTKQMMDSKPKKSDIAQVEYLHLDADPGPDETPEQFKTRMLPVLEQADPRPTFIIDSGNGLHALWRLRRPVKIYNPDIVADMESRNLALAEKFGAKPGTQNIDRILRLPGTWNWPNRKKRNDGRVKCRTKLISYDDTAHPLDAFPPKQRAAANSTERQQSETPSGLPRGIRALLYHETEAAYQTRSGLLMAFLMKCLRANVAEADIVAACLDPAFRGMAIYQHCREQNEPENYIKRQIARARDKVGAMTAPAGEKSYELVCAADIVPRAPQWLWRNHLLVGGQELMAGIKGMGKSQIQISWIASVTSGHDWPDGTRGPEPGNVIMVTTEDAHDTVIVPRLIVAGANMKRVFVLKRIRMDNKDRTFLIGEDLDALEQMINEVERTTGTPVDLVTIDPITAVMGKINDKSVTDVRGQLGPLKEFAERMNVAFSTITHPPKAISQRAIDNFVGSQAFIAAARVGHLCLPEMTIAGNMPTGRNLLTMAGTNHKLVPSLAYQIEVETYQFDRFTRDEVPYVAWQETVDLTSDQICKGSTRTTPVDEFVREVLQRGALPYQELLEAAEAKGFGQAQLVGAKKRLRVESQKDGLRGWKWILPVERDDEEGED
jgi:hypothetical protein